MLNRFVVVDLETTGNAPKKGDKIIQFAAVVIENEKIIETFSSLINPCRPIPAFIEELTGINDGMVKDAPLFAEIAARVASLLEHAYFVAHNAGFDLPFLREELINAGYQGFYGPVIDTVEMARILFPSADGYKLTDLSEQENLIHAQPHQADSDALVTAELFLIFFKKTEKIPYKTLKRLAQLASGLKSDLQQLFNEMLLVKERKIEELPNTLEMVNGLVIKKFCPEPNHCQDFCEYPFPVSDQDKMNMLKEVFRPYEKRNGQFRMMNGVYQAFQNASHALIEAGTGVGKSIGYLLPAAYFSKQNSLPVIISTYTIQLQEQLLHKEVQLLKKLVPFSVKTVLLKGRDHYLSLERFSESILERYDNYDTTLTKMQILVWLLETETGDKDELNLSSGGQFYWNKVKNTNAADSLNTNWNKKDFYTRAKNNSEDANIIITNHSLLLSDLTNKNFILPDYQYAVIDEGHHFEKAASHFFGKTLDYLHIRLLMSQLGIYEQKQLFFELENLVDTVKGDKSGLIHFYELNQMIKELMNEIDEFFKLTLLFAQKNAQNKRGSQRLKVRLTGHTKELSAMNYSAERCSFLIKDVHENLHKRLSYIQQSKQGSFSIAQREVMKEISSFQEDISNLRKSLKEMILANSNDVKWVEIDLRAPQNMTTIIMQPVSVADYLDKDFFRRKKSIVITSATLTVNHRFHFICNELGLSGYPKNEMLIPSPFDYKNQVQIFIPEDLPEINSVLMDEYVTAITEHIITIAEVTKGRMLILFTSHEMLKKTYELLKESGFLNDYAIIAQGITGGSQTRLTRNFQRYEKAILLGTSSFWEGVDIPGEDLSCLIIVRLPFSPPDEPYTEAKYEYAKKRGDNTFLDYALPEAILRFKQGFGRLIRTKADRGVLVIFDKRVITTRYGSEFFKSIPPVKKTIGQIDYLIDLIDQWLWYNKS